MSVGIALVVGGLVLTYIFASMAWAEVLHKRTAVEIGRPRTAALTAQTPPAEPAVARCTTADLRRPLPPMPRAKRVVTRYVVDNQTQINPAPNVRPDVSARAAWLAARAYLTSWNRPRGGTASLLFGRIMSTNTVPSTKRLAWVAVLHHTALKVHGTTTLPCQFFQAYAAVDARTGKAFLGTAQALFTG
jgi:hypothetical protein